MRSHVADMVAQIDLEVLVAEDTLLLAEYGVCEFGIEGRDCPGPLQARSHERDGEGIVGICRPYSVS